MSGFVDRVLRSAGRRGPSWQRIGLCLLPGLSLSSCATLGQLTDLLRVDFFISGTSRGALAGVPIDRLTRFEELRAQDLAQLGAALLEDRLPLSFVLHVGASNPSENAVAASLVALDWRLLVRERETIRGRYDEAKELPAGEVVDLPLSVELDLLRFFEEDLRGLVETALDAAGGGEGANLRLVARPTIRTALGPIEYPDEITIVKR